MIDKFIVEPLSKHHDREMEEAQPPDQIDMISRAHRVTHRVHSGNVAAAWLGLVETDGAGAVFTFAFPTEPKVGYVVEYTPNLAGESRWTEVQRLVGDGIERVIRSPLQESGFFRVRQTP